MKKFLLLIFLLFASNANATDVLNYYDALELAKSTDQKVVVYFGADWCDYCKKIESSIYTQEISNVLKEKDYLFVKVDIDFDLDIKEKFRVRSIPDIVILDKNEKVLKRVKGYQNKASLGSWLNN